MRVLSVRSTAAGRQRLTCRALKLRYLLRCVFAVVKVRVHVSDAGLFVRAFAVGCPYPLPERLAKPTAKVTSSDERLATPKCIRQSVLS